MIELALCTISFRHHLISLPDIASWASHNGFQALELWGIHALNLSDQPQFNAQWLAAFNLRVVMISDYLPMEGDERLALQKMRTLCRLAKRWGAAKIRTFAGKTASAATDAAALANLVRRLRRYSGLAAEQGLELLVETHPNTYADNTVATHKLLDQVQHSALKVNFDVLHIWEAGEDPVASWHSLAPHISHLHLKNIRHKRHLTVFAPHNVYAAAGSREGMVPLFEGACDYARFIQQLPGEIWHSASLEWFGGFVKKVVKNDNRLIRELSSCHTGSQSLARTIPC
jgi:3-dehydroshikimate dehydratase